MMACGRILVGSGGGAVQWGIRVFPRPFTHGGICPHMGGTSAGGQSINGGTHEGDIDLMGTLMGGLMRGT